MLEMKMFASSRTKKSYGEKIEPEAKTNKYKTMCGKREREKLPDEYGKKIGKTIEKGQKRGK